MTNATAYATTNVTRSAKTNATTNAKTNAVTGEMKIRDKKNGECRLKASPKKHERKTTIK